MAFITNADELQALLDACSSTQELELLIQSILIPEEWIPMAHARPSELTAQEIPLVNLLERSKRASIGDQEDGKDRTEQILFSKCTLFVCNKWDLVPENESQEVKNDSIHKLKDVCPGVDPESQIIFMSIERAKRKQKYGVISERFLSLMDGMKSVILNSIEARLELHWTWLHKLLSRISVQAKLFVANGSRGPEEVADASSSTDVMANASNSPEGIIKASKRSEDEKNNTKSPEEVANALRSPEEINERMEKIVHRLKEIEEDEKKVLKDFRKLFNDQVNSGVQRLSAHLSSDNIRARFTSWSLDEAPDENGSWDEVEENVNNVLCSRFYEIVEQWEEDNKVFTNAYLFLMQQFQDYYDDVEFQLQNLQSDAAGDDINMKSGKEAFKFRFSSVQKVMWRIKNVAYGLTSYFQILMSNLLRKGLKTVHGSVKYLYRDLLLRVSLDILAAGKDEKKLKPFVEGKLNEAKLFLDHLEARLPELIEADRQLYELLMKKKTERSRYKTMLDEVTEQRRQLSRFGITGVCAAKIKHKELDWKEDGSSCLGVGSSAVVYQGTMKRDGKNVTAVALKVWNDALDFNNAIEIMEEIKNLRMLNHPHIVQFYGISLEMDTFRAAVVMEKCKGNLKKHIFNSPQAVPSKTENPTVFKDVCRWAKQISDGLAYIHAKGVVHRDLKLANILLSEENTVKIADVGMAKAEIDITGTFAGTPIYMAPEVFHYRVYGTMADIYSLGLIMWEMWYGRRVFADAPTTTLQEFFNWIDEGNRPVEMQGCKSPPSFWEQLMKQCWDGNPVKRPTAKECHERMIRMRESVSPESSV